MRSGAVRLRSRLGKRAGEVEHSGNRRDIRCGIRPHRGSDRSVPNAEKAQRGLTTDSRTRRAASKPSCTTEIFEVVGQLLSEPSEADYLSPILRAQTLTLLEALGPGHKRILLQFLYELSLLGPEKPGLSLKGANLREAKLAGANLGETSLERVHLERANLAEANLVGANLRRTNLREANLKEADLSRAFLQVITKEDSLKRRSMRRSETMLPSSQTTSSASRTGEAVWKEELEES